MVIDGCSPRASTRRDIAPKPMPAAVGPGMTKRRRRSSVSLIALELDRLRRRSLIDLRRRRRRGQHHHVA
jgi:hypothetical protein